MSELVRILLSNLLVASLLALLAWPLGRYLKRPALGHALWLLVLLKLVTPPIVSLPLLDGAWLPEPLAPEVRTTQALPDPVPDLAELDGLALAFPERLPDLPAERLEGAASAPPTVASGPADRPSRDERALALLLALFAAGSLWSGCQAFRRTRAFRRALRWCEPVPAEVARDARLLALRFRLRRLPRLQQVEAPVPPMLWSGLGRARLILPSALVARLDQKQRSTLLAHELAHYARRDHWVRPVELVATILWWWCPLLWLARRELRELEESCCDAWVVWAVPDAAHAYAGALLDTVDFMADGRLAVPPAASGVRRTRRLERRLTMIMDARTPRHLGLLGRSALVLMALAMLPLVPTFGQSESRRLRLPQEKPGRSNTQKRLEALERRLKKLEAENRRMRRDRERLSTRERRPRNRTREQGRAMERRLEEVEAQNNRLRVDLERRARDRARARDMADKALSGRKQDLARATRRMEEAQVKMDRARERLERGHVQLAELEAALDQARHSGDEARAAALQAKLQAGQDALEKARRMVEEGAARLHESRRRLEEGERAMVEHRVRQDHWRVLEAELKDRRAVLDARNQELHAKLQAVEEEMVRSRQRGEHVKAQELAHVMQDLRAQNQALKAKAQAFEDQAKQQRHAQQEARKRGQGRQNRGGGSRQARIQRIQKRMGQLQTELKKLGAELEALREGGRRIR